MNRLLFLLLVLLAVLQGRAAAAERPNIVVILADDLGYSDLGCYGSEIPTPSLDRLAENGLRLSRFTNGGMCVVSRASMLTGQWWPRALPDFDQSTTLPELLAERGYRNALIGKWHLEGHPLDHGFHHFFGFLNGFADHFKGNDQYRLDREPFTEFGVDYYSSDAFAERAVAFIERESKKPFFLTLSFQAPHNPLQAPAADIARHRGKYLEGWQAVREARFARQKALGLFPDGLALPAYPQNLPKWESLTDAQRDLEDLRMATYVAMVERMDTGIGRVVSTLEKHGQLGNTLILFLSDNGSDPFSVADRAMIKQGKLPGDPGSNYQPGLGWAYASVTPWRLYKVSQHGGGITTGAVVHWPNGNKHQNPISDRLIHMIDLLPTVAEITGAPATVVAGESFAPLFTGEDWCRRGPVFYQYMDNRALRDLRWTLAEVDGGGWRLFDRVTDTLETHDVSVEHPAVVKNLAANWHRWWQRENRSKTYKAKPTRSSLHYQPQGDTGTGTSYVPSPMPHQK